VTIDSGQGWGEHHEVAMHRAIRPALQSMRQTTGGRCYVSEVTVRPATGGRGAVAATELVTGDLTSDLTRFSWLSGHVTVRLEAGADDVELRVAGEKVALERAAARLELGAVVAGRVLSALRDGLRSCLLADERFRDRWSESSFVA